MDVYGEGRGPPPFRCQKWNGEENKAVKVETPFQPEKSLWTSLNPWSPLKYYKRAAKLASYNRLPTAFNELSRKIKSFSDDEKWITIATLPYSLERMSFINLDSGDLLIIGFEHWRRNMTASELLDCHFCFSKPFATIHKLHNGDITVLETFDKVFCSKFYKIIILKNLED